MTMSEFIYSSITTAAAATNQGDLLLSAVLAGRNLSDRPRWITFHTQYVYHCLVVCGSYRSQVLIQCIHHLIMTTTTTTVAFGCGVSRCTAKKSEYFVVVVRHGWPCGGRTLSYGDPGPVSLFNWPLKWTEHVSCPTSLTHVQVALVYKVNYLFLYLYNYYGADSILSWILWACGAPVDGEKQQQQQARLCVVLHRLQLCGDNRNCSRYWMSYLTTQAP